MIFIPFLIVGAAAVLLALVLIFPAILWVWWIVFAAAVSFYAPAADAINYWIFIKPQRRTFPARCAEIDRLLGRIEKEHGAEMREYAVAHDWLIPQMEDFLRSQKISKAQDVDANVIFYARLRRMLHEGDWAGATRLIKNTGKQS